MSPDNPTRVVILGGGFGGMYAALEFYLSKLPRLEKKLRVALDWTLDILFSKDLVQFATTRAQSVSHLEEAGQPPTRNADVLSTSER